MTVWVTNASPLIFLAKLDRLDVLKRAASAVLVPSVVIDEVLAVPDAAAAAIQESTRTWLEVRPATETDFERFLSSELGDGEAAAIALAAEEKGRVLLDDHQGREWARRLDVPIVGTLGLLLAARVQGEIPSLRDEIEALRRAGFRASQQLVEAVLVQAGED